jgi:hypothetical protein
MREMEVEGYEEVEWGLLGLLRLWKCVEKLTFPVKAMRGALWFTFSLIGPAARLTLGSKLTEWQVKRTGESEFKKATLIPCFHCMSRFGQTAPNFEFKLCRGNSVFHFFFALMRMA